MSEKAKIYISKRCPHCIELIKQLNQREDIKGNITIIIIDDEPFPNYIKAVPCMVLGNEMWKAGEIFSMLADSANENPNQGQKKTETVSSSEECSVDGICSNGGCLIYSALEGIDSGGDINSYYSTIEESSSNGNTNITQDNYNKNKSHEIDNAYEKLIQERGEVNSEVRGGLPPSEMNFSR